MPPAAETFSAMDIGIHPYLKSFGLDYTGSTFVAKSMTLLQRDGNMPLDWETLQPRELFPTCIKINRRYEAVLNAVGLSGPGAEDLFKRGIWQQLRYPFFISYAFEGASFEERLHECEELVRLTHDNLPSLRAPVGIEINPFCPNVHIADTTVADEIYAMLDRAGELRVPLVVKANVLMPYESAFQIECHKACDALCVSNTIPFGRLPRKIDWKKLWGSYGSPLMNFGGGGLSGPSLFPLVISWIERARLLGFSKPIIGCGGILFALNARCMFVAGANAIQLGSVSILKPWRVRGIIKYANAYARETYGD